MKEEMRQKFIEILGNNRVLFDEPMSQHTTFQIGGPADVFVMPENYEQIREVLRLCKEEKLPFFVLGNGSNLLVSDSGYRGVIIQMDRNRKKSVWTVKKFMPAQAHCFRLLQWRQEMLLSQDLSLPEEFREPSAELP